MSPLKVGFIILFYTKNIAKTIEDIDLQFLTLLDTILSAKANA